MLLDVPDSQRHGNSRYRVTLAASRADVLAAERLRHQLFSIECGAITPGPDGLDADDFDDVCDHLIVWHISGGGPATGSSAHTAVATYRLLPAHANDLSPLAAGLYSARAFDLSPLEGLLGLTVEAGRSCVRADHRSGAAISMLWGGIARYMHLSGYRYLVGSASVSLSDGGASAAGFADLAAARHAAPERLRCRPYQPFDPDGIDRPARIIIPPLIRGYLRLGAVVCGPGALDADFGTADFLVLLDLERADQRYLRFFLGADAAR